MLADASLDEALDEAAARALAAHAVGSGQARKWESIPWRWSLADGVAEAARAGKPVLLWVMNGCPLGAT